MNNLINKIYNYINEENLIVDIKIINIEKYNDELYYADYIYIENGINSDIHEGGIYIEDGIGYLCSTFDNAEYEPFMKAMIKIEI